MGDFGVNQTFEYVELALDSWDASVAGGTQSNDPTVNNSLAKYSWPMFYFTSRDLNVAAIKIIQAEIPFVYDVINGLNNVFIYTSNSVVFNITIPKGTYTGPQLATQLQTLFQVITPGFLVVWSNQTLRFTFTHPPATTWSLEFPTRNSPYSQMGFLPSEFSGNVVYSSIGVNSVIVSETIAQVTGPYYLYVNSRKMGSLINFNLADGSPKAVGPQVCRIPVNVQYGSVIFYSDPSKILLISTHEIL